MQRKGDKFLARWADIMTGRVPKFHLLHPDFVIVIGFELIRLSLMRVLGFGKKQKSEWKTLDIYCYNRREDIFQVQDVIVEVYSVGYM